jgi:hypothetical protein
MLLSMMPRHDQSFGSFQRADGETFEATCTIWESPPDYDYWLGFYEARHTKWVSIRMAPTVPKEIARSIALAVALQSGAPLDRSSRNS